MTQHTDLIDRLRKQSEELADTGRTLDYSAGVAAANALEATAKKAFEAMPHDIPQRMKDAICEETGWSGSMVSRMYTELRKAFTGEPYRANEDLDAARLEIEQLKRDGPEVDIAFNSEGKPIRGPMRKALEFAESAARAEANYADQLRKDAALVAARERERIAKLIADLAGTSDFDKSTCDYLADAIRALNTEGEGNDPITG